MKFRKKPVEIEALQFTGKNINETEKFVGKRLRVQNLLVYGKDIYSIDIETLEGIMRAEPNDWIIKGVKGEFYPCKPDIFEVTYERIKE